MRQSFSSIVEILVSPEALLSLVTGDYYSVDRFIGFCQTMQMLEKTLPEEIDTSLKSTQARFEIVSLSSFLHFNARSHTSKSCFINHGKMRFKTPNSAHLTVS